MYAIRSGSGRRGCGRGSCERTREMRRRPGDLAVAAGRRCWGVVAAAVTDGPATFSREQIDPAAPSLAPWANGRRNSGGAQVRRPRSRQRPWNSYSLRWLRGEHHCWHTNNAICADLDHFRRVRRCGPPCRRRGRPAAVVWQARGDANARRGRIRRAPRSASKRRGGGSLRPKRHRERQRIFGSDQSQLTRCAQAIESGPTSDRPADLVWSESTHVARLGRDGNHPPEKNAPPESPVVV